MDERTMSTCPKCLGDGEILYPSTSTWRGGIGGSAITEGTCDRCWGTGNHKQPGQNLRKLWQEERSKRTQEKLDKLTKPEGDAS